MAKKDKFAQMQQGGGVGSFQETLVNAAATVAAIERRHDEETRDRQGKDAIPPETQAGNGRNTAEPTAGDGWRHVEQPKFMRLPNPQIPLSEYNLVSVYCGSLPNMTRQDFVELAIVEKLHAIGSLDDEAFAYRQAEIRNRPPRGQRKGTKAIKQTSI